MRCVALGGGRKGTAFRLFCAGLGERMRSAGINVLSLAIAAIIALLLVLLFKGTVAEIASADAESTIIAMIAVLVGLAVAFGARGAGLRR